MSVTTQPAQPAHESCSESMSMTPVGPCWICGEPTLDRVWMDPFDLSDFPRFGKYRYGHHTPSYVVRCSRCGLGQPEALPSPTDFFEVLYSIPWSRESLDLEFDLGYKDFIFDTIIRELNRRKCDLPPTLLDVGAHVGRFVYKAREAGWEAEGAELNPVTADYARERTGFPIHQMFAQALKAEGRIYTAVTLTDVLEHIPDPLPLVSQLRGLVRPGGVIAVKVPHGPMQIFKEALRRDVLGQTNAGVMVRYVHVNHFTVDSLRLCLEKAGFQDISVEVGAPECVPRSARDSRRQAFKTLVAKSVYRMARTVPGGVRSPFSLHLQAYATTP